MGDLTKAESVMLAEADPSEVERAALKAAEAELEEE